MGPRALLLRWQNFRRFRRAARHADVPFVTHQLRFLQQVCGAFGLLFVPAEPLGDSRLRGTYDGLAIEIGLVLDEIRIVTTFVMGLPGPLVPEVLASLKEHRHFFHEHRQAVFAACLTRLRPEGGAPGAAPDPRATLFTQDDIFWHTFSLSEGHLACSARYLRDAGEVAKVLLVLGTLARTLTRPGGEGGVEGALSSTSA